MNTKAALRAEVRALRDALPAELRDQFSTRISQHVLNLDVWQRAQGVLLYLSIGSEFNTAELIAATLAQGKRMCLPRVDCRRNALEIHWVDDLGRETVSGAFGVREPRPNCPRAREDAIDFVLTPGLAFTKRGERLGYGAGYYDRLLGGLPQVPAVAAAFALQIRDRIPTDPADRRVHWVVTEAHTYCTSLTA